MKTPKILSLILVLMLIASTPVMAKMTVANPKYKVCNGTTCTLKKCANASCANAAKKCNTVGTSIKLGTKCPNGQSNCKPGENLAPDTSGTSMSAMAEEVVRQVNSERAKNGLKPLVVSQELTRAACVRATEIASFFSHTRPNGQAWSTVSSSARGENIARGQQTANKVMAAWMSSSGHRANILRASFGSIGVCAYKVGNVMHWVQLFGQ